MGSLADIGDKIKLVTDVETAYECKRWLSTIPRVSIDTETTGLNKDTDEARTIQFGDSQRAYVIPLEGVTYDLVPRVPLVKGWGGFAVELLRHIVSDPEMEVVMHNMTYDHTMSRRTLGVHLPRHRVHDTRLMQHVLDSKGSLALKNMAKKIVDPMASLGQSILEDAFAKYKWDWRTVPMSFKPYWFYAGLDTILTMRVFDVLYPQIVEESPRSYELELAVAWPCEDMERRGVAINRGYTESFLDELQVTVRDTEAWCKSQYGVYPGSDDQVIRVLRNDGVDLIKRTKSGAKFSVDKEVLASIDHPLAQQVLARRQAMKLQGYLRQYLDLSERDGLIHPSINTVGGTNKNQFEPGGGDGVRTGRMSMSDPNLQNVPTRTKEGKRVRMCFVPRGEDRTWIKCDADQIESRILAHLSGDESMRKAFIDAANTGTDFFVNMARQLFDDPSFEKSDPRRQFVKNGVYAKIYSAGIPRFAATTGSSIEQAAAFMHAFDAMFPRVPQWINEVGYRVAQRAAEDGEGWARSPLTGRKHRVEPDKMYPIINYIIQGMAGELLKLKIVEASNAGLDQYMMFPVHDEIDLDVPNEDLPDVLHTLSEVMNDDKILAVPMTWSADVGPSWGEVK